MAKPLAADLEGLVLQCLAKEPHERPASASALQAALLACEDAPRYERAAAFAWWKDYRAKAQTNVEHSTPGSPATMAIDFNGRSNWSSTAVHAD